MNNHKDQDQAASDTLLEGNEVATGVVTVRESSCTNRLVSIDTSHIVNIWDTDTGAILSSVEEPNDRVARSILCCSGDGNRLAVCRSTPIYISKFDTDSSLERVITVPVTPGSSPDAMIWSLCMNYNGSRVLSGHSGGHLCYWAAESGEVIWSQKIHDGHAVYAVDISFDGALVVTGGGDEKLRLCFAETCLEIWELKGHLRAIRAIKFNCDASRIASGSIDKTICIWDVASSSQIMILTGHTKDITCLSYSCDGSRLTSGAEDESVRLWDVELGVCLFVLRGHTDWVWSVSFSSDGNRIASGGHDNTIILWDTVSGSEVKRLEGHSHGVINVLYLPAIYDYLLK